MFSEGYGFVVDYLAEVLRSLRNHDYADKYNEHFTLSSDISTRDRDGIHKTFSGLMKILYPDGGASKQEIEELLRFAIEGRKRVKDQLMRIDSTYGKVRFSYVDSDGQTKVVTTLEEEEYPQHYHKTHPETGDAPTADAADSSAAPVSAQTPAPGKPTLQEKHLTFQENQKGLSYDTLIGPYLKGASLITVTDPYIRLFYQVRNFMEFLETVVKQKAPDEEVTVHLVTSMDEFKGVQQKEHFEKMKESTGAVGINFTWEFDATGTIHARHIVTDHGWKISLDRGLDIFQAYEMNDAFSFANRLQQYRPCKAFEVTFIKT
jgi:ATP-dependent Lon protease